LETKPIRLWDRFPTWEEAEAHWQHGEQILRQKYPLKTLKAMPKMVGITQTTRKNLRWKALRYLVTHDADAVLLRGLLKKPIRHAFGLLRSLLRRKPYVRDGDFFLYGFGSETDFKARLQANPDLILVVGFSYCHKPFECPSGRFTDECQHDPNHSVCGQ
jgi:hypothetical protein